MWIRDVMDSFDVDGVVSWSRPSWSSGGWRPEEGEGPEALDGSFFLLISWFLKKLAGGGRWSLEKPMHLTGTCSWFL